LKEEHNELSNQKETVVPTNSSLLALEQFVPRRPVPQLHMVSISSMANTFSGGVVKL
jgi:hypothetical protein